MNQITNPPNEYNFGLDFNYAVWTQGTAITLVNVPWNNDYRDTVRFADRAALNAYIDGLETSGVAINNLSYVKPNTPIRLDIPFNAAYKYNYLRARNPLQPIAGDQTKDYYYFITDVRYIAPNTTEIVVQLDVWQTWIYDITIGNCYIERGHIGIANENAFNNYGRDYLTVPEGLDIGGEYQVVYKKNEPILVKDTAPGQPSFNNPYNILVVSTVDLKAPAGTQENPSLHTATGGNFFSIPSGASYYVFETIYDFEFFLSYFSVLPWVTQGIISITLIPPIKRYLPNFEFNPISNPWNPNDITEAPEDLILPRKYDMTPGINWRNWSIFGDHLGNRYRHLRKFYTYPYMVIELTAFNGSPVLLKPEAWASASATLVERIALTQPGQRMSITPFKYNAKPGSATDPFYPGMTGNPPTENLGDDNGEWLDVATIVSNFPTTMIVNNSGIAYIAANRNSINFQHRSADWAQQRALGSNQVSYDQATSGMNLANELTGIGINADRAQTALGNQTAINQAIVNGIGGVLGGGMQGAVGGAAAGPAGAAVGAGLGVLGGVGGAIMSGINTGIQVNANNESLAIRSAAATRSNAAQVGNAGFIRDTNKNLADWAAKGDYANAIAGINAKVQDAQMIQPTTSGQAGGEVLGLLSNSMFVSLRWKMIDPAAIATVGEYWLRYGYAVRRFGTIPANLMVMTKFTYWKLLETYITGAPMPETFKQAIRGIFEKGVTVWANPVDIGNIDIADNDPLEGISY